MKTGLNHPTLRHSKLRKPMENHSSKSLHIVLQVLKAAPASPKISHSKPVSPLTIMFQTNTNYDRGVNVFNPEGRLFQVEYAIEAIKLGTTAIGIKSKEGVVLAVEKRITSTLIEPSSLKKLLEIDAHVGCAMSGLTADARTLVDYGRVEAQNHFFTYDEPMKVSSVVSVFLKLIQFRVNVLLLWYVCV